MTPKRLTAWRRRLGVSPVMAKRLARLVRQVQREEREACVKVAESVPNGAYATGATVKWAITEAIRNRK